MPGMWKPSPRLRFFMNLYVLLMALLVATAMVLGQWRMGIYGAIAALPGVILILTQQRR